MSPADKFLIFGCQRSGTSLLGMALEAHKDIELLEEENQLFHAPYALTMRINLQSVNEYSPTDNVTAGFKAPRDSHRSAEAINLVKGIKIIWISREIYQVVASMLALKLDGTTPWALMFAPREIIKYLYTGKADHQIASSYQQALALQNTRLRAIAMATICWCAKQRSEQESCTTWPQQTYRMKYDDLVTRPDETLSALLLFLGLEWDAAVLRHSSKLSGERPGGSSTAREIDADSLYKWKNELTIDELKMIDSIWEKTRQPEV